MPYWIFGEDVDGKLSYLGCEESQVRANMIEDDYSGGGTVHIKWYDTNNLGVAKQKFKYELARKRGLEVGHKNIKNRGYVEE